MATRNESKTPWTATHPGTILRYELEDREISQKGLCSHDWYAKVTSE